MAAAAHREIDIRATGSDLQTVEHGLEKDRYVSGPIRRTASHWRIKVDDVRRAVT
jgi:hypothetical protein